MRHSRYLHFLNPVIILAVFLIAIVSIGLVRSDSASAKELKITTGNCTSASGGTMTNASSPSPETPHLCLGEGTDGMRYFQFAVNLGGKTETSPGSGISKISVIGKTNAGKEPFKTIGFSQDGDDRFVSLSGPSDVKLGLPTAAACDSNSPDSHITITATNVRKTSESYTWPDIDLCDKTDDSQTYVNLNEAIDAFTYDGQTRTTNSLTANLCLKREQLKTLYKGDYYTGQMEQRGLTSITLSGVEFEGNVKVNKTWSLTDDKDSGWYSLIGGQLTIPKLKAGTYIVKLNYNDRAVLANASIGDLSENTTGSYGIELKAVTNGQDVKSARAAGECYSTTSENGGVDTGSVKEKPVGSCQIDHIGWIICPVIDFMGKIVDGAYSAVSTFLTTPNINTNTSDPTNALYKAWAIMRTIANVAFVIAFLIIIFSQLTSVGITNYGIKKMLPRLVIAAILVNISYIICAIGVDLSNILGSSMKQVFDGLNLQLKIPVSDASSKGTGWGGLAATVVAVTIVSYAQLSILLPALITAMVAILTVFLVLTLRQALIIMLIVISPLAFVAFLLPNTENLFTKWRKMFMTLLLMFPIIAGIFGASALASTVIMGSSPEEIPVQIMGALVAIIPLFLTPIVMKTAGGVLNKFGGMVNNPTKGPFDRMRKGAEGYRNNRKEYRNLKAMTGSGHSLPFMRGTMRRKGERAAILNNRKAELNRANAGYISDESMKEGSKLRAKLAQGGGENANVRAEAQALAVRMKLDAEDIENTIKLMVEKAGPDNLPDQAVAAYKEALKSGDEIKARAANKILSTQLGAPGLEMAHQAALEVEASGEGSAKAIDAVKKDVSSSGLKGKDNAYTRWGYSGKNLADLDKEVETFSGLTPAELAGQNLESLENSTGITIQQAKDALEDTQAKALLDPVKKAFFKEIAEGHGKTVRDAAHGKKRF